MTNFDVNESMLTMDEGEKHKIYLMENEKRIKLHSAERERESSENFKIIV